MAAVPMTARASAHPHDDWLRRATAEAIAQAKKVVGTDGVPTRTPVGNLGDYEWGWIVSAAIVGWIDVKAQEAVAHGLTIERAILAAPGDPEPWDAGAVAAVLPQLADVVLPWDQPVGAWDKASVVKLLWAGHGLVAQALAARTRGKEDDLFAPGKVQRDLDDEIPF